MREARTVEPPSTFHYACPNAMPFLLWIVLLLAAPLVRAQDSLTFTVLDAGQLGLSLDQRRLDTRESRGYGARLTVACSTEAPCDQVRIRIMSLQGESRAAQWLLAQPGVESSVQLYQGQSLLAEGDATSVRWAVEPDVPLTVHLRLHNCHPLIAGDYRFRTEVSIEPIP
jgi:hypothetical protein